MSGHVIRNDFYERLGSHSLAPLWESLHRLVPREPNTRCAPVHWSYETVRPLVMEAGEMITAEKAERRVLVLENPALRGQSRVTNTLYAGLQLVLPGEIAPSHRHVQNALRLVVDGDGAFTAVGGERTIMRPGDFIITPNWEWHDHGNESDGPMIWLDGLDIPIVEFFEAGFAEPGLEKAQPLTRPDDFALTAFGNALVPVDWEAKGVCSPMLNYPYRRTREVLDKMARFSDLDPHHGAKLRFIDPTNGRSPMPTIGPYVQLLPQGFATQGYRCSSSTVFVPLEGEGETRIGETVFRWRRNDVFVVPSWMSHTHHADTEAVLFSYNDRPIQEALGLWREARGQAA